MTRKLDPRHAALNDLNRKCCSLAALLRDAAGHVRDSGLASALSGLADEHEAASARLELCIEDFGLPRRDDPDRTDARRLLERLKGAVSSQQERMYLRDRIEDEGRLEEAVEEFRSLDWSEEQSACLDEVRGLAARSRELLLSRLAED